MPYINQKLGEYNEEELIKVLKELENSPSATGRKENVESILREIAFWRKAMNRLESNDEHPFLNACSLMDEIAESLQQISAVRAEMKNLEDKYVGKEENFSVNEIEKVSSRLDELDESYDFLLKQAQENCSKLNYTVIKAIRKEIETHYPTEIPEIFVKKMAESPTPDEVVHIWKLCSVQKYITDNGFLKPLLRERRQLVYVDEYGERRSEKWVQELNDFSSRCNFEEINEICLSLPERFKTILDKWALVAVRSFYCFGAVAINQDNFYWFAFIEDKDGNAIQAFDHVGELTHLLEVCLDSYPDNEAEEVEEQKEPT